jgi:hypothetical protein
MGNGEFWLDVGHGIAHPVRVGGKVCFVYSTRRDSEWYIARKYRIISDITIGPSPWRRGKVVQICLGCRHGTGREDVMNPAAASLRPDQDSMQLADCAHGAVTQLTGHIIAMIDPTTEPRGLGLCSGGAA